MPDITETLVSDFDRQIEISNWALVALSLRDFKAWLEAIDKGTACLALAWIEKYGPKTSSGRSAAQFQLNPGTHSRVSKQHKVELWLREWRDQDGSIRYLRDQDKIIRKKNFRYIAQCLRNGEWVLVRVNDLLRTEEQGMLTAMSRSAHTRRDPRCRHAGFQTIAEAEAFESAGTTPAQE